MFNNIPTGGLAFKPVSNTPGTTAAMTEAALAEARRRGLVILDQGNGQYML